MRELKRKKDGEGLIYLQPQASLPRAGQKSRSQFHPSDQRSRNYGVRRLITLLEVARMLTSELDLAEIVHQVLVRAIEVIPAADAGISTWPSWRLAASLSRISSVLGPAFLTCRSSQAKLRRDGPSSPGVGRSTPIWKRCKKPSPMRNRKPIVSFGRRAYAPPKPRWRLR